MYAKQKLVEYLLYVHEELKLKTYYPTLFYG